MKLTDWPSSDRPREKLLKYGAASLADAELLAIFLRTGVPGHNVVDLARILIDRFGSLSAVVNADRSAFCAQPGLGVAKYAQLQAAGEIVSRCLRHKLERGVIIHEPDVSRQFLRGQLAHRTQEVFACIYLDTQHRLLRYQEHFFGTIDSASVYPRELVKAALHYNAAAVILSHNHPSGVATPSRADLDITQTIRSALQLIDVRLLDHMIVAETDVLSFAEQGYL